jgi:GT2 family glycosyltransferase
MDRATWQVLQGFSPRYFLYAEDADLCWRCHEAGLPVIYSPEIAIIHSQGDPDPTSRDRSMVRLFDGLLRFVHYNYTPLKRQGVRVAVLLDMLARMTLFTIMKVVRPQDGLSAPRVRGAWRVMKNWMAFQPSDD